MVDVLANGKAEIRVANRAASKTGYKFNTGTVNRAYSREKLQDR